ncbi:MAG: DUF1203 domain-containing protein [Granulosicoccus sp.]|nr:DUF1203 domain-containing protein [Granulosicoccus sp.]
MSFVIRGLERRRFEPFFALSTAELAAKSIVRTCITKDGGAPCRLSLADLDPGESALLLNYQHLPESSPFQSSHALYVGENRSDVQLLVNEVPEVMRCRLLSVRTFNRDQMMLDADVIEGDDLGNTLNAMFERVDATFVDIHYAKPGCWAARAHRAEVGEAQD